MAELDALLEAERQGKLDRSGKGNSLFSEVEDRREKVEVQLKVFEEKFSLLKENYDSKLRELQKTKLHNAQLLGLVGGGRGGGEEHSARLEELLEVERERNRQLSDRLDSLEKVGLVSQVVASEEQGPTVKKEGSEEGEQHTTSPEFAYMAGLVAELKGRVGELQVLGLPKKTYSLLFFCYVFVPVFRLTHWVGGTTQIDLIPCRGRCRRS